MKPVDRRKFFSALHRGCRDRGLELSEEPDAGSGSHGSLIFTRAKGRPLRIVLAYSRKITPGVQRSILRYVAQQAQMRKEAADRELAQVVFDLLDEYLR
jgi:hypothetical protein